MVADRDVLVVGQQRIVGAELAADVRRVVDARVEVGVVADARRQVQGAVGRRMEPGLHLGLAGRAGGQERAETAAQGAAMVGRPSLAAGSASDPAPASAASWAAPLASRAGPIRPEEAASDKSRIISPMATPPRGAP